ncbi:SIR2 family protein [Pseudothauera nasutitermitis]|uniref:SIR2 family protein n=1 Tax=Pseudothauera nasutitermitis TaxID=2565930 RepID=A0A4S4B199_9RHOO|nr:SIR2 family protein [Pseudothauera nasutitermitis]THF64678.1 SIR2 family protein [Pseudothauera nasutitermitis]
MQTVLDEIRTGLAAGTVVPFLGADTLADVTHRDTGQKIPASSDELILALNNGQPMAPRLMYEFPRAAMNIELKRGRSAVNRALERIYADDAWSEAGVHRWLAGLELPYLIDLNRDTGLQKRYAQRPHTLIVGTARINSGLRYRLYRHDGQDYGAETTDDGIDPAAPVLFKPCGTPWPVPQWIASDADYVDYITELMGGFAIPPFLKERRKGLKYLVAGTRLNRDTTRMLLSDFIFGAAEPAGWALIAEPNDKERRFCARLGLTLVEADVRELAGLPEPAACA